MHMAFLLTMTHVLNVLWNKDYSDLVTFRHVSI